MVTWEERLAQSPSADETSLPPPAKEINWPVLWGVIGGVVVIGLLIFFLVRREAYYALYQLYPLI